MLDVLLSACCLSFAVCQDPEEELFDDGLDEILDGTYVEDSAPVATQEEDLLIDDGLFMDDDLFGDAQASAAEGVRIRNLKGYLGTQFRSYLRDRSSAGNNEQLYFEGELEIDLDLAEAWTGFARPRFRVDALDSELKRFEPLEAYVSWAGESADLRVGQFIENWGIADTFNPLDLLNRRDLASDFLDTDRLGELGARLRLFGQGGEVIGEPTLALYAMPVFRRTDFPTAESRFSFSSPGLRFREDRSLTPSGVDQARFAIRGLSTLNTSVANADVQLAVVRGPEAFPTLSARPRGFFALDLIPEYYGANSLGGGFRAVPNADVLGDFMAEFTFKFEAVYKWLYDFEGATVAAPDDYFSYVVGLDRILDRPFGEKDQITVTLEYVAETGASDPTSLIRPFRSDAVVRLFWEANNFSRTSVEARVLYDVESGETILQTILETQLRFIDDDVRFFADWQYFHLEPTEPSVLNFFANNTSVTFGLFLDF